MVIEDFIFVVYFTLDCSCNLQGFFFYSLLLPGKRSKNPGTRKDLCLRLTSAALCLFANFLCDKKLE